MPNIKEITARIASVSSTQQITKAMKMVSAAKLAKSQSQLLRLRPYAQHIAEMLIQAIGSMDKALIPIQQYIHHRPVKRLLLVIISADKGLCGSFNSNVVKKTWAAIQRFNLAAEQIDLLLIGKKAFNAFKKREYTLITTYSSLASPLHYDTAIPVAHFLTDAFTKHQYDRIELIYNRFNSAAAQDVQIEQFLPIVHHPVDRGVQYNYIYEPSHLALVQHLVPLYLEVQFYKALLESSVSEHGARMTTMSKATDNANTLLKALRITYNKTRQAAITNEILEIAAGSEAQTS